jgi:3-methyladenine DNA glycosylase/8-oxoguanine DNA glycosylase
MKCPSRSAFSSFDLGERLIWNPFPHFPGTGVGAKVAACTLLFGFNRYDAFPIDVWIKRVIEKYFHQGFEPDELGEYAGVAQQFLFYYERYLGGGEA